MGKKYEECIVSEPMILEQFEAHAKGKYQILMSSELVPGADFFITGGVHKKIHQREPITKKHYHDTSEAYLFIGKKGALHVEVELDDEKYIVESPCAVYVPKGVRHTYRYLEQNGPVTVVAIVQQSGEYVPR
jgi:mannose-6-phosphate isomerase-like protein (cupin superfamily)